MVYDYRFVKRLSDELVGLASSHGQQLFNRRKLRKPRPCDLCEAGLKPGDRAYGPITNGYNRMHRLCVPCVKKLELRT